MNASHTMQLDLAQHFDRRLDKLIYDIADTCERVDIRASDSVGLIVSVLVASAARISICADMTESELQDLVHRAFEFRLKQQQREQQGE